MQFRMSKEKLNAGVTILHFIFTGVHFICIRTVLNYNICNRITRNGLITLFKIPHIISAFIHKHSLKEKITITKKSRFLAKELS